MSAIIKNINNENIINDITEKCIDDSGINSGCINESIDTEIAGGNDGIIGDTGPAINAIGIIDSN